MSDEAMEPITDDVTPKAGPPLEEPAYLLAILEDLHADEQHWTLVARSGAWFAAISANDERAVFDTLDEAILWLGREAVRSRPESAFAQAWAERLKS